LLAGPGGRPPEQMIRHLMPVPWPLGPVTDQSARPHPWYTPGPDPAEMRALAGRPRRAQLGGAPHGRDGHRPACAPVTSPAWTRTMRSWPRSGRGIPGGRSGG